jgi:hypothetical protein
VRLDRRAHARETGADDENVVLGFHHNGSYTNPPLAGATREARGVT